MKSKTLTVSINSNPKKVYEFISNLENMPKWAKTFCGSITKSNGEWIIETPQGPMGIKIAPKNDLGILDHTVIPAPGVEVFVPMRVVPNGGGSEVVFTLFQQPDMSVENFAKDQEMVEQDLATLKQVMERSSDQ
ncbi:MAG: hypothetical protein A2941_02390 [Candidatus Yanofskybacteria bacterium RIFCSPLOWO2_01_FULL_49_17]|uniref:Polyketide cyclase n=1 Tax=Candidatus Yanofskybacteria bacterium RIFCSPLOWO2_01_FULL_49_17 TaxID=1802700 RepID=A0A1F8GP87_9BACT|nr:MAG: hypothetical protein A2941_02390 [Candidatus Yanofskybacteria bacterium RIFCSPLOWO2_01_FULL_49_17]